MTVITRTWPAASRCTAAGCQRPASLHKPVTEPVDARQRGEGVIDRRRQRADRDLNELIDGKGEILRERSVRARGVCAAERSRDAWRRVGGPDVRQRLALDDEVAGSVQQSG